MFLNSVKIAQGRHISRKTQCGRPRSQCKDVEILLRFRNWQRPAKFIHFDRIAPMWYAHLGTLFAKYSFAAYLKIDQAHDLRSQSSLHLWYSTQMLSRSPSFSLYVFYLTGIQCLSVCARQTPPTHPRPQTPPAPTAIFRRVLYHSTQTVAQHGVKSLIPTMVKILITLVLGHVREVLC